MSNPTENPNASAQEDIRIVLQETLIQQVQTLLNFTRTEYFALQVPDTETHIMVGPRARIAEFLAPDDFGASSVITAEYKADQQRKNEAASTMLAALARQSQAAQPSILTWKQRLEEQFARTAPHDGGQEAAMLDEIADLRRALAGQSQATKAQADEILSLHRDLAAEKLRADQGWQRAEAKSKECIELRERMAVAKEAPAVPEGWKLVPVEPTDEMIMVLDETGNDEDSFREAYRVAYKAMLEVVPVASVAKAETGSVQAEKDEQANVLPPEGDK